VLLSIVGGGISRLRNIYTTAAKPLSERDIPFRVTVTCFFFCYLLSVLFGFILKKSSAQWNSEISYRTMRFGLDRVGSRYFRGSRVVDNALSVRLSRIYFDRLIVSQVLGDYSIFPTSCIKWESSWSIHPSTSMLSEEHLFFGHDDKQLTATRHNPPPRKAAAYTRCKPTFRLTAIVSVYKRHLRI